MGVLDDLSARLVAYGGIGTTASPSPTIFAGQLPAGPDQCVALKSRFSSGDVYTMGRGSAPVVSEHAVQTIIRATTFSAAEALAWRVYAALNNWEGTLNGHDYLHIIARHVPVETGQDENKRTLFTCNYVVRRRDR